MKKLIVLFVLAFPLTVVAMDAPLGHKDKEKNGKDASGSSHSSSDSKGQLSVFENVELHKDESPRLNTARLKEEGKVVISDNDLVDLARVLKENGIKIGSQINKEEKRKSVVYLPEISEIPALDLANIKRDMSNQSRARTTTPDLEKADSSSGEPNFDKIFEFYLNYLQEKKGVDITHVKNRMIQKIKKAHDSPPASPQASPKDIKREKTKKAVQALHNASSYRETARTKRTQNIQKSPHLETSRAPKATEVLTALSGLPIFKDPEVHSGLEAMEQLAFKLLSEKLNETHASKTKTTWMAIAATVLGSAGTIITPIVTYYLTKQSNNNC